MNNKSKSVWVLPILRRPSIQSTGRCCLLCWGDLDVNVFALIRAQHYGNTASVRVFGELSEDFEVTMRLKKCCVLAPLLVPDEAQHDVGGLRLGYRFDGGVVNLQRLRAAEPR